MKNTLPGYLPNRELRTASGCWNSTTGIFPRCLFSVSVKTSEIRNKIGATIENKYGLLAASPIADADSIEAR
jgi:hypothetical protein